MDASALAQEAAVLGELSELADKLMEIRPFSPGEDERSASASMESHIRGRIAFRSLKSDPPSELLEQHRELVNIVTMSMSTFSVVCNVVRLPRYLHLESPVRALWPHLDRWSATVHPVNNPVMQRFIRTGHKLNITSRMNQAYFNIIVDDTPSRSFLRSHPAVMQRMLELWLRFPQYILSSSIDTSVCTKTTIMVVKTLHELFVNPNGGPTAADRALFVDNLIHLAGGSKRALYYAFAQQIDFIATFHPQVGINQVQNMDTIWKDHHSLLIDLVEMPELARSKIPARMIDAVVSAARQWQMHRDVQYDALPAIRLINALCRVAKSAAPLAHAAASGVFDVLRRLPQQRVSGDEDDISHLARLLCAGMCHARVIHALVIRHPDIVEIPHSMPATTNRQRLAPPSRQQLATWQDVARVSIDMRVLYSTVYRRKKWQLMMSCHNTMGPHNRRVQICPCANAFYCSRSCQRMHRSAHLDSCRVREGPWGLRGIISLADALFICIAVRAYIDRNAASIEREVSSLRFNQSSLRTNQPSKCAQLVKQAVIRVDITDVLPDARHKVDTRTAYIPDAPPTAPMSVVVEVALRAGKTLATRVLPFTIRRNDLKAAGAT